MMKKHLNIAILGGDRRQRYAVQRILQEFDGLRLWGMSYGVEPPDGTVEVSTAAEALEGAQVVLLPLPTTKDGLTLSCEGETADRIPLSLLSEMIPAGALVIGGKIPESFLCKLRERGLRVVDYFHSEQFQVKNAYLTAEGAVSIAANYLTRTLRGAEIAVTGYGRIAEQLCDLLLGIGAKVTLLARREGDLALAKVRGCRTVRIDEEGRFRTAVLHGYDLIYNTVPVWLFDRSFLEQVDRETVMVELASAPGGFDICSAKELGSNICWAPSLPGKYAPQSAGELVGECVLEILSGEVMGR